MICVHVQLDVGMNRYTQASKFQQGAFGGAAECQTLPVDTSESSIPSNCMEALFSLELICTQSLQKLLLC